MREILRAAALTLACTVATALGQAPAPPPSEPLLAFGDDQGWIVTRSLVYVIGDTNDRITVPAGFVTDLASIPRQFWGPPLYLTPTGRYSRAAIVHDYLYWSQKCTRDQADRLLVIAMKESAVTSFDEAVIYEGVHVGGDRAWKGNAADRARGIPRILPVEHRRPSDPNLTWPVYAQTLMDAGIKSVDYADDGTYCHYGDSTDVPR